MKTTATPEQLKRWTAKYGRTPKRSEIAWELEQVAARSSREAAPPAIDAYTAMLRAVPVATNDPATAEQIAFSRLSSQAEDEQRRAHRAAGYAEVESPAEAYATERAADQKHEER